MFGTAKIAVKRAFSTRTFQAIIMVISAITVITTSTLLSIKTVTVKENGVEILTAASFSSTVKNFINANGIELGEHDLVSPPLLTTLSKNQVITISRAFPLNVQMGGQTLEVMAAAGKPVAQVLEDNNIILDSMDIVSPSLDSVVSNETQIIITKVTSDMIAVQEELGFETISTPNSNLDRGVTKVVQKGIPGTKEVMYKVVYHNGQEAAREVAGERIVTEAQNKIVEYGTKYASVSRGSVTRISDPASQLSYSKVITVTATAYDLSYESCGKRPGDRGYGITASGRKAARGIIAVDPSVIPMGSKLYIESLDSSADYGYAIAGDKGGAIKGNRIDLFMDTRSEALRWGRRNVRVYILD